MPRAKKILTNLKYDSCMTQWGSYIYNGTKVSDIPKGSRVIAIPYYKRGLAVIKKEDGSRGYLVTRSSLQEYVKVKPEKYLVVKNNVVKEIFGCGDADAKENARKLLGMKRLTKVQITKVGDKSYWHMFMPGVRVRVTAGDYEGREFLIVRVYYDGCYVCNDVETQRTRIILEQNLSRI